MRLDDIDPTENVRDLGSGGRSSFGGGGGGGGLIFSLLPMLLGRKMGCGSIAIIAIFAIGYFMLSGGGGGILSGPQTGGQQVARSAGQSGSAVCNTPERTFSCRVMASTDQTWAKIFAEQGAKYRPATLNFYSGGANSGCGYAASAVGPYYCPPDQGVFLDTSFFDELANRFGAKGDFAEAYVIAHEIGHHIQNLTGVSDQVSQAQSRGSRAEGNAMSVRLELQADCYAGVWAARNRDRLEPGDIEEGMTAANAIGDDTLQQGTQGAVSPDSFTHGTSAQRMKWLRAGIESGDPASCDTFSGAI